ncbi:MAG: cyclic nucleotide-binding domain-containing protein [Psychromonas sp.]|nr:cyclic nucleotide-binding domain-containing protein [Psychromonas sp.]
MITLLCVDSDIQRLSQLCADLAHLNDRLVIVRANNLQEAKQKIKNTQQSISAIICAHQLSDGSALALFKDPQQLFRKIVYANNPSIECLIHYINEGQIHHFVSLPYKKKELITVVKKQINKFTIKYSQHNQDSEKINNISSKHKNKNQKHKNLQNNILYCSLYSDAELSTLVINSIYELLEKSDEHQIKRTYRKDHLLTREGHKNDFLWFIVKGDLLLRKINSLGEIQDIIQMHAGSIVGSMSFMTGEPAFSSCITLNKTEVLKVNKTVFSQILQSNTQLLGPFTNLLLRNFNRRLQQSISTELALQETLLALKKAHSQLIESEKMVVLGNLVAGVAHELNNPISAILRNSESLSALITKRMYKGSNYTLLNVIQKVLSKSLTTAPLPTSTIRERIKVFQKQIGDKKTAKKLVTMNIEISDIPSNDEYNFEESIHLLYQYHQIGSLLHSNIVCAKRITDLVKSLKHYAGHDNQQVVKADINKDLEETLFIFENKLKQRQVLKEYQKIPKIDCHPKELQQVWTNIIANAIDATKSQSLIRIATKILSENNKAFVQVIIEDNGSGIPKNIIQRVFELNYTTKREGNFGLGIGLSICEQIIKRHNGIINIESEVGVFTRFTITLPIKNLIIESNNAQTSKVEKELTVKSSVKM